MLCDACKKNQATYHSVQVSGGVRRESHLCAECLAKQQGFAAMGPNLLSGMLGGNARQEPLRCSLCGMEYARFQQTGKLGCAQCYQDFRSQLVPTLQRIHGHVQHQGHVPASAGEALKARRRIDALKGEMQEAVQAEDFERAAQVRDMLREAEKELRRIQHPFGEEGVREQEEAGAQEPGEAKPEQPEAVAPQAEEPKAAASKPETPKAEAPAQGQQEKDAPTPEQPKADPPVPARPETAEPAQEQKKEDGHEQQG